MSDIKLHQLQNQREDASCIEYVIYTRKSTEKDETQKESIPQQLEACFAFADNNDLRLKPRPSHMPPDSIIVEQIRDAYSSNPEKCDHITNKYMEYYVIGETKSAKESGKRKLWGQLVKEIHGEMIDGLLGYSPDRFARNLLDGGEIISFVDNGSIDLKFTSFVFENTAAGHMMLGIFFVFAEHYSKKLSEDSIRGTRQKSEDGRALGVSKLGYESDEKDHFSPHPVNFPLIKKAFERKIYDGWNNEAIAKEMVKNGWQDETPMTGKRISDLGVWDDTFFYGLWKRYYKKKKNYQEIDLRGLSGINFKPAITEEEFYIMQEQLLEAHKSRRKRRLSIKTKRLESVTPLRSGMVINEEGSAMNFSLPNPKRFEKNLEKLRKKNPEASLSDLVEPHQIKYKTTKKKEGVSNNIDFETLDTFLLKHLKSFKVSEELKQAYLYVMHQELEREYDIAEKNRKRVQLLRNKLLAEEKKFMKDSGYGNGLAGRERSMWEKERDKFKAREVILLEEEGLISNDTRDEVLEQTALVELISNLPKLWKKANYVQKGRICEILLLNIEIKAEKPHRIKFHADFKDCFSSMVAGTGFEPVTFGL